MLQPLRRIGRLIFMRIPLWCWRICFYGALGALVACAALILALRYAVLPNIEAYRADLEQLAAAAVGQRVAIGEIRGDWRGLRPQLTLERVIRYDAAERPALELQRIETTLAWSSLFFLEPRFHAFEVHEPHLDIRRSRQGVISVGGITLAKADGGAGLTDWVLRQPSLAIRGATVSWIDEQRQAPELRLQAVSARLENRFFRHRFGLRASGPDSVAGNIDLRADFSGDTVRALRNWEGRVYVQVDYADLAAHRQWLDLPIDIARGRGAVRVWADFAHARLRGFLADVRLADVDARLGGEREALRLEALSGRIGWHAWRSGFSLYARRLSVAAGAEGTFRPLDFDLRKVDAQGAKPARTELKASTLDLGAIAHLAAHVPLEPALMEELARYAPHGTVSGLSARWSGEWPQATFELKARFEGLGIDPVGALPGLQNVSGSIDATDKRGLLTLDSRDLHLELPQVFAQPLAFQSSSAALAWTVQGGRYDLRFADVAFANPDLQGTLQGSIEFADGHARSADLHGTVQRAEASRAASYVPLSVSKGTRAWLQEALLAGAASDVKWRLKGDLARFPFADNRHGAFELAGKVRGGVLQYAPGWPRIEEIAADLAVSGTRLSVRSATGTVFGVQLARVLAVVPDLAADKEFLEVTGEAQGATPEFLRFVAASPLAPRMDPVLKAIEAQGRGRLQLKLALPLAALAETRVAGSYQFLGNRLRVDADLPPLENVEGRIDFTESSVVAQNLSMQVFGGPATLTASTQGDAVLVKASGRANMTALRKLVDLPLLQAMSGSSEWRGSLQLRGKIGEFVLESGLQGISSTLPAPLGKAPADILPLRLERRLGAGAEDSLHFALGSQLSAIVQRRREGANMVAERVSIGLGVEPAAETAGSWLRGSLPHLDLDRWRAALQEYPSLAATPLVFSGFDLQVGALDVFGRRFHDVSFNGRRADRWRVQASARELSGNVAWDSAGKGALVARFQRLALPATLERIEARDVEVDPQRAGEYPALDIEVEEFSYKGRALGRLELNAVPDGRDWRIERLQLHNPDATLKADGLWRWQPRAYRTQLNLQLETNNIGKLLARLQYPAGVRAGAASLAGTLSWTGPPQDIDYPTLSGQLTLQASRGQFVRLDPGIGKLLSILSLQALPRRVTLDFKDVFSEGFAFDTIQGTAKIERGIVVTDDLRILGSSAKVGMRGEIDLARETQTLRVRVTPSVGDSVATVSALLGGPVVGIGVYLAQKLLNDPLGQLIAYDFSITGPWSDPAVSKVSFERSGPG